MYMGSEFIMDPEIWEECRYECMTSEHYDQSDVKRLHTPLLIAFFNHSRETTSKESSTNVKIRAAVNDLSHCQEFQ